MFFLQIIISNGEDSLFANDENQTNNIADMDQELLTPRIDQGVLTSSTNQGSLTPTANPGPLILTPSTSHGVIISSADQGLLTYSSAEVKETKPFENFLEVSWSKSF